MDEITISANSLNTYLLCPRKYYWQKIVRIELREQEEAFALQFGKVIHNALQGNKLAVCPEWTQEQKILAETMIAGYSHYYETKEVEKEINIPLESTRLVCYLDALVEIEGQLTILEYKTYANFSYAEVLRSWQARIYAYAYWQKHGDNLPVKIQILIRPSKIRRKTGRKTKPDETHDEYRQQLTEFYTNKNLAYPCVDCQYTLDDLLHTENNLWHFASLVNSRYNENLARWLQNPAACMQYGRSCQYNMLCIENHANIQNLIDNYYQCRKGRKKYQQVF